MNLIEIVQPDINMPRSINLERDRNNLSVINDYQLTGKTIEIFNRFTRALLGEKVSAWSLTGPYGMGKSSYCNFLLSITGPKNDTRTKAARRALKSVDPMLYRDYKAGLRQSDAPDGFFRVYVTAAYESVNHSLARGLQEALKGAAESADLKALNADVCNLCREKTIPSQELLNMFKATLQIKQQPMIIILDEFGKNLDFLSHHPNRGDIFLLQQLAETESVFMWVVLHQAFDEYAAGLSSTQRNEWSKVQGRFEDVSFVESYNQMLYLMHKSLKRQPSHSQEEKIWQWAQKALTVTNQLSPSKKLFDLETVANIYPFHPLTALALIELSKKFAQNDRTLLSFICSGDPLALPVLLNRLIWPDEEINTIPSVGLDYLYDYFIGITGSTYNNRPESQRWLEIDSIIQQAKDVSILETSILKSIGVLNLLSSSLGIKASAENVVNIMEYAENAGRCEIIEAIKTLVAKGALIYREYAGEYRLWEGSDFDVADAVREQKGKLSIAPLNELLQEYLPQTPLIASRHAFTSGTVRRFERRWLSGDQLDSELMPFEGYDGLIVYTFGTETDLLGVPEICKDKRPLMVASLPNQSTLQELALEVAAVRAVFVNRLELNHDGVARREVKYRIKTAEQHFREYIHQVFSPGAEELLWYSDGNRIDIKSNKDLSSHISYLCDRTFNKCPVIGNEMISYEKLSSAVAKARRELIEAMTLKPGEGQLGLSGFGPEVAIYRSLVASKGLHIGDDLNGWHLRLDDQDPRLNSLWQEIDDFIRGSGEMGCTVEALLEHLQAPPYGMRLGPTPIFVCLYLLVKSEEIAIFREGSYLPFLSGAEVALLVKRPDLYVLKPALAEQWERAMFSLYHELFAGRQLDDSNLRNKRMLGVVGPLVKFYNDLPDYAKRTRKISREAQRVRSSIQNAIDPKQLLLEEIPEALGTAISKENADEQIVFLEKLRSAMSEIEQSYPLLNADIQRVLLDVFKDTEINHLAVELKARIRDLYDICEETELKSLMKVILRDSNDAADWSRGIAGIVMKRPTQSWGDEDFLPFSLKIRDYAQRIEQLQILAAADGLIAKDKKLISVMDSDGTSRRLVVSLNKQMDTDLGHKLEEIMSYPKEQIKILVAALLDQLGGGESDVG